MNINDPALLPLDTTPEERDYEDYLLATYNALSSDAQRILRRMSASPRTDSPMWGKTWHTTASYQVYEELLNTCVITTHKPHEYTFTELGRAVALAYWRAVDRHVKAYMCADWFEDIPF